MIVKFGDYELRRKEKTERNEKLSNWLLQISFVLGADDPYDASITSPKAKGNKRLHTISHLYVGRQTIGKKKACLLLF